MVAGCYAFGYCSWATELIKTRELYGAIILGPQPEVLTAAANSPVISQVMSQVATQLQKMLQVTGSSAKVAVTDVVPLTKDDERGVGLALSALPLVLGGIIGGVAIALSVVGRSRRLVALGLGL